jgi:all-trans-retinol 13,14-reductase
VTERALLTDEKPQRRRVRAPAPEQVDVAIIGSGLGGLSAGCYLAQRGLRVACFESHYVAGGCATQFRRGAKEGIYHFDVGLHYIGDCGAEGQIPGVLKDVGVHVDFVPMDQDGFDTLIFPDFRFRIPADVDLYRQRLLELFPGERRGIDRYLRLLRAVMRIDRERSRPKLRTLLGLGLGALSLIAHREHTIGQFLDTCTQDPKLRAVLLGQSGDYGLPPSEASAMLHLGLAAHYFRGAYYPKGGGQVIADRLAERLEALGGSVHLRRPVEQILMKDGRAIGLLLERRTESEPPQTVRARVVLSNADLILTLHKLLGRAQLPSEWQDRSARFRMADAIFMTYLGLRGDLTKKGMSATNYWQFDGYDMESFYRAGRELDAAGLMQARGCYITSASLKDPANAQHHAPPGITNLEIMTLVPGSAELWGARDAQTATPGDPTGWKYRRSDRYQAIKKSLEDQMIDRLEKLFPGSAADIVYRESATPLSHTRFTRATDGTGYGLAGTPAQFLGARPGSRGPVPGLYLCGASTRSGHGILGALMSGRSAARRIAADLHGGT